MSPRDAHEKPAKLAFFVMVSDPSDTPIFLNVSDRLGRTMPFERPKATCAMQVKGSTVAFSLLHLSKRTADSVAGQSLAIPRGPLEMLDRRAAAYPDLTPEQVVVEFEDRVYRMSLNRDDAGIGFLELVSIDGQDDASVAAETFELPRSAVRAKIFLRSPKVDRTLAVGFIGYLGRPGDPSTVTRVVAQALKSITHLAEFRLLAVLETVNIPPAPSRWATQASTLRLAEQDVATEVPVWLFTSGDTPALVASGSVVVTVDLENANPSTGRLLCHYTPSETIADLFEGYRPVFDAQVERTLRESLGADAIGAMAVDIVLGSVEQNLVERIREALEALTPLDMTTQLTRVHELVEAPA